MKGHVFYEASTSLLLTPRVCVRGSEVRGRTSRGTGDDQSKKPNSGSETLIRTKKDNSMAYVVAEAGALDDAGEEGVGANKTAHASHLKEKEQEQEQEKENGEETETEKEPETETEKRKNKK